MTNPPQGGGRIDKLDNGFTLNGEGGVYLATTADDIGSDPFMYWQTNLADNVWSYDVASATWVASVMLLCTGSICQVTLHKMSKCPYI